LTAPFLRYRSGRSPSSAGYRGVGRRGEDKHVK
jgi:hypothetical protein